eukprot:CAMPEP_0118923448 /NCGR_PEP_ID=MMETSP1169-20130426/1970_1 /TAXON_ID=36882 /ORGANISM="Pyramimonas obovata, Strain CCMP722" /LENGTH=209 /DNA_ID=CAMNT_0006864433 /DNA_START=9 /DNA_END=638 /DNA_ORIENTATION=+
MAEDPYEMKWESLVFENGSLYQGTSQGGNAHGRGCLLFPRGDRYEGDFYHGAPHGYGVYSWTDGSTYAGQMRSGQPSGCGRKKYPNGETEEGEFLEDAFIGDLMSCSAWASEAAAMAAQNSASDSKTLLIKPLQEQERVALSKTGVKKNGHRGHEVIQKLGSITVSAASRAPQAPSRPLEESRLAGGLNAGALLGRLGRWAQTRSAPNQ